uniref:Mating-type protein MAT-1 n=1 Tax=Curvularia homomorpha TaxID=1165373 RepID=Q9Y8D5_9PLEO|nr:mating type protein MAT-2/1 [Curvularia homomorpha]
MNTAAYPPTTSANNLSLAEALKIAEARFEAAVQGCKDDWNNGNDLVILQDNIPQLFGGILVEHFKRCVGEVSGFPVDLTVMDGGDNNYHTLVQMPKNKMISPQLVSSPQSAQTLSSEHTTIDMNAIAAGLKKAPRPMNCWIIFRDAIYKHLKAEFPHLTIQEISTRCSHIWHSLSPEAKKPWQDAAQSAKEEHLRRHPDYKYSPRKPGQKKKRQSRKSKRDAATSTAPEVLQFQLPSNLTTIMPEVTDKSSLAANTITTGPGNTISENISQCFDPNSFREIYPQDPMATDLFYNAESIRHSLLDTEFTIDFNMDTTFALFNDEMLAFRDGADGDATGAEIARFIATRTGAQMVQLMRCIKEPAAQAAFTAKLLVAPPALQPTTPERARKALNAFVGFRCYYIAIPVFKQWPMKKLSNLISLLWEADPNKSLWSLMTKAWSTIRDQIGKEKAPLDQFFRIICPHLNLPDPASYLEIHGWTLTVDKEGDPTISQNADSECASIGAVNIDMALSVEDIIAHVQSFGYAAAFAPNDNFASSTFLGQAINSTLEKNKHPITATQTASKAAQGRLLARNKRRAKRQAARNTGYRVRLDQDIINAHQVDPSPIDKYMPDCYLTTTPISDCNLDPFYNRLTDLLSDQVPNYQGDASSLDNTHLLNNPSLSSHLSYITIDGFSMNMPNIIDYDAFRLGANEDVTLPLFDDAAPA